MRQIIIQKIKVAIFFILLICIAYPSFGQTKKEKGKAQLLEVTFTVVKEDGSPIPNANVVVGEGFQHLTTGMNGEVSFKAYASDVVTITCPFFEKNVDMVMNILNSPTITLLHAKTHATSDDIIPLPFTSLKKRHLTGPETVVKGSYFERYPSTDLRNTFTGLSSLIDVRENAGSPGLTPLEGRLNYSALRESKYGLGNKFSGVPLIIVDDVPADISEMPIDPAEIESISLLKGILATALYSPAATGGVLYIKTKTGTKNERILNVDIENGVSVIDRMPDYVNGVDYAKLNNQARVNDGLDPLYSENDIAEYAKNNPYDLKYPNSDYKDMFIKNTMGFRRINVSSSGGDDAVQYFSYLGYAGEGDILKSRYKSDYNRITARQNVNVKVNNRLSLLFGVNANVSFRRSPNYGYNKHSGIELPSLLSDIQSIPPIEFPVYAYYDKQNQTPWYGVSKRYTQNPVGNMNDQGYYTDRSRATMAKVALTWDMKELLQGLKSMTYLSVNTNHFVRVGKQNDYLAYIADVTNESDTILTQSSSHSAISASGMSKLLDYYYKKYAVYEKIDYSKPFDNSDLYTSLTYNITKTYMDGIEEPLRQQNLVWQGLYSIKDKYSLHAVLNYAGTGSFDKGYRFGLFPVLGASWVISDEKFMPRSNFLNYLKLRVQGGIIGNEKYFKNLYYLDKYASSTTNFGAYTSFQWFGNSETSAPCTYQSRAGTPELTWEKRKEINAGFDAVLLNNSLDFNFTYYDMLADGAIIQISNTLPYMGGYNSTRPHVNYNTTRYYKVGIDLAYKGKINDFSYIIGGNITINNSKRIKYDEPNYRNKYQYKTGLPSDVIFGLKYLGKFSTDEETTIVPQLFDDELHAGDLKYADMNKDGVVDDNDQCKIGHSSPRFYYAVNLMLKYKKFEFFVLGNGRTMYDLNLGNRYFKSGWGDNNYSEFVRDNIGDAYPRLTYYQVSNNFKSSDFWLTKGGYFKIQNIELSYTIPAKYLEFIGSRGIKVYVRGSNLLTVTSIKTVDPESTDSGVTTYPLFKTFSGGFKFNF